MYEKIRKFCDDHDISVTIFEKVCGFGNGYIGKMQKRENPGIKAVQRMAQVMGITVEELLDE